MTETWKVVPVILLTSYNVVRICKKDRNKHWWKALLFTISVIAMWFLAKKYIRGLDTYLLVFSLIVLFSFVLLQILNYRMSLSFHLLFIVIITIAAISGFQHPELSVVNEYLMLLIYYLAESNQRYMKKTYEESSAEYQNMVLSKQVSEVQNIYLTMRGWKHDYHNHLQTLKAHMKLNQIKEAGNYLDKLELDLDQVNTMIETGNVNLDAILNSKLSLASKGDIDINYKANVPSVLSVSDIDLCVLIGNLIDNAVEACDSVPEGEGRRYIRLYIGVLKKQLYITVTNSTKETIRRLDEEYITTKRGNHGHGLKRINKIVEKYEGYISRNNEPGVFVTEILLPL